MEATNISPKIVDKIATNSAPCPLTVEKHHAVVAQDVSGRVFDDRNMVPLHRGTHCCCPFSSNAADLPLRRLFAHLWCTLPLPFTSCIMQFVKTTALYLNALRVRNILCENFLSFYVLILHPTCDWLI